MRQRDNITSYLSERVLARLRHEYSLVASEVWVDDDHRVDFGAVLARVETVNSYEIVRLNYALPIVGEWSRDQLSFSRQETRIHVPQGSITQGEYDFS